ALGPVGICRSVRGSVLRARTCSTHNCVSRCRSPTRGRRIGSTTMASRSTGCFAMCPKRFGRYRYLVLLCALASRSWSADPPTPEAAEERTRLEVQYALDTEVVT